MRVRLTKLASKHQNLRTDEIVGNSNDFPQIGQPFTLYAEPLDEAASLRVVRTSPVTVIWNTSRADYEFHTENSRYKLDILEEVH